MPTGGSGLAGGVNPAAGGAPVMPGMPGVASGAMYQNSVYPVFDGFEVERRTLPPGAQDWSPQLPDAD